MRPYFVEQGFEPIFQQAQIKNPQPKAEGCYLAHPEGFEPPTKWFEATYSIQLSYGCGVSCIVA
jgi:hypothetical protein